MKFQKILSNNSKVIPRSTIFWPSSYSKHPVISFSIIQTTFTSDNLWFHPRKAICILSRVVELHPFAHLNFRTYLRPQSDIKLAIFASFSKKVTAQKIPFFSFIPQVLSSTSFYSLKIDSISRVLSARFHPTQTWKSRSNFHDQNRPTLIKILSAVRKIKLLRNQVLLRTSITASN